MKSHSEEEEVFAAARRLKNRTELSAYLDAACSSRPELRRRVEELLRAAEKAEDFFAAGALEVSQSPFLFPLSEQAGDRIGPYKLLQQIGQGGAGTVYMAEQEQPVRRRVALKIIKLGMDTTSVVARFEAERQALAIMDHPNIAKVFDAGATETGRPFFVMELVQGASITAYCDEHRLSLRERLGLFIQVCNAVQHAHQKGLIHRDLKPSNILVTINDGVAVPKVIDFGIAKAIEGRLTDQTLFTVFEQFLGTPEYMSPEQTLMSSVDVDTRSDIFSLGVLLYELLTGKTPLDPKILRAGGIDDMRRTIREKEAPPPSARLQAMPREELSTSAQRRRLEGPRLINLVRVDLDWIVMRCLEKDRARRYETASALAQDIQRYLNNEPVEARPPSALDRMRKAVRRNKVAFAAATAISAILLIGTVVSTAMFLREREARQRAEKAENAHRQLRDEAELRELDLRALQFLSQSKLPEAERTLREVVERQVSLSGRLNLKVANTFASLSQVQLKAGALDAAEKSFRQALDIRRQLGANDPEVAVLLAQGAEILEAQGKAGDAEALQREALNLETRLHGDKDASVAASLNKLAGMALRQKRWTNAEALLREAAAIQQNAGTNADPALLATNFFRLCEVLRDQGKFKDAARLYGEVLPIHLKFWPDDPDAELKRLVEGLLRLEQHEELGALWQALSPAMAGSLPYTLSLWRVRADYYARTGQFLEAAADFRRVVDLDPGRSLARLNLAALLVQTGQIETYREHCRKSVEDFKDTGSRHAAEQIAKACLLRADSGVDLDLVSKLSDFAVTDPTHSYLEWFELTKTLCQYRDAQYDLVVQWLARTRQSRRDQDPTFATVAEILQAMCEYQLGSPDKAQAVLRWPAEVIERTFKRAKDGDLGRDWVGWIIPQVLLREAEALIGPAAEQ